MMGQPLLCIRTLFKVDMGRAMDSCEVGVYE